MTHAAITQGRSALLFDVDGTLADSIPTILAGLGDTYEHFTGVRPSNGAISALIGRSLVDQMTFFGLTDQCPEQVSERVDYALERFRAHKSMTTLFDLSVDAWKHAMHLGWKTALVTSKDAAELNDFLNDFPVFRRSGALVCSSDVSKAKPAPDSALLACKRLGVQPSEAIMVGDSAFDLLCARSAGMPCVSVSYGAAQRFELEALQPDVLLDSPEQFLKWTHDNLHSLRCHEEKHHPPMTATTP